MDRALLESLIHRVHTVGGYRLRPYSLAVAVALEAVGNPLMTNKAPTPADVLLFLKIASAPDPLHADFTLRFRDHVLKFRLMKPGALDRIMVEIQAYIEDYSTPPHLTEAIESDVPTAKISAPWAISRVASLHQNTNLTNDEIWNLPFGYILWLEAAGAELRGAKVGFYDPENPEVDAVELAELARLAAEPMPETETGPGWEDAASLWR